MAEAAAPRALTLRSFAKINLYFGVRQRRPDGYHAIETVFQTVDLFDDLRFERSSELSLRCDNPDLDIGPSNLILRAARALNDFAGSSHGAHIDLAKRIPIAAGLAGGSGNAAAALTGLNSLWGLGLPQETLATLALTLGSDVPYCLRGGTTAARGRGEDLEPLPPLDGVWFVLVHPRLEVSTAWVYGHPRLPRRPRSGERSAEFQSAMDALAARDWPGCLHNDMEDVVFEAHSQIRDIKRRLLDAGCVAAAMSGSGPTIFGVAETERGATRIAGAFTNERVTVARPVDRGLDRVD